MCGIAGMAGPTAGRSVIRVRAMCDLWSHRGPDGGGEWVAEHAVLGIRRLRVIDLISGDQPKFNEDGSVVTVFNGEIYNFMELRAELISRGHTLTSASDTEVIVHL